MPTFSKFALGFHFLINMLNSVGLNIQLNFTSIWNLNFGDILLSVFCQWVNVKSPKTKSVRVLWQYSLPQGRGLMAHKCHGITYSLTAKIAFSRHNLLCHGSSYYFKRTEIALSLTARFFLLRHNLYSVYHGTILRNLLSQG